MLHISIAAEHVGDFLGFHVTNSLLFSVIIMAMLLLTAAWARTGVAVVPSKFQSIVEIIVEGMYDLVASISPKHVKEFFPLVATIFIFVLLSNWLGLLPGIAGFGIEEYYHGEHLIVPFLRSPSADLNTTFALALIAVGATQYYGLKHLGLKIQISKYISFKSPIDFFIGILELISEFSRVLSFSFRLFGNVFAGEVMLLVLGSLIPILIPLPFLALEVFVGFIQAFVFAILTAVLLQVAVEAH